MASSKHAGGQVEKMEQTVVEEKIEATIHIERIFLSKLVFEPKEITQLLELKWRPKVHIEIKPSCDTLSENRYQVSLDIHLTISIGSHDGCTIKVVQAGIFKVGESPVKQHILSVECPGILFPYVREAVDNVMVKATLPPLSLAPVNFQEIFQKAVERNKIVSPRYSEPVVN